MCTVKQNRRGPEILLKPRNSRQRKGDGVGILCSLHEIWMLARDYARSRYYTEYSICFVRDGTTEEKSGRAHVTCEISRIG